MFKSIFIVIFAPIFGFGQIQDWQFIGKKETEESVYFCETHLYKSAKFNPINGGLFVAFQNGINPYICKTAVISFDGTNWGKVGTNLEISKGAASNQSLAIGPNGTIYVAYRDNTNGYKTTVKFFDGSDWQLLGYPWISNGNAKSQSLEIDKNGKIYLAYCDSANGNRATVLNNVAGAWLSIGSLTGIAQDGESYLNFKISPSGQPYITYLESGNAQLIVVKRYNGATWENVGGSTIGPNFTQYPKLEFSSNGTPFLAYAVNGPNLPLTPTVLSFDGSNWQQVGNSGLIINQSKEVSLSFSPSGVLHIAYISLNDGTLTVLKLNSNNNWEKIVEKPKTVGKTDDLELLFSPSGTLHLLKNIKYFQEYDMSHTSVMTFDGTNWGKLKRLGNGFGAADYINMEFSKNGKLYIVYRDLDNDYKTSVLTLNNNVFENVGKEGISKGESKFQSIAISPSGVPYIAFQDCTNKLKTTILSFDGINWNPIVTGYGVGTDSAYYQNIVFNKDGVLYLAYSNVFKNNLISVLKLNGNTWEQIGSNIGSTKDLCLAINSKNIPYIAYSDFNNSNKTNVKRFIDGNWETVGNSGISTGGSKFINIAFNKLDNPIVGYSNILPSGKLTVLSFNGINWSPIEKEQASLSGLQNLSLTLNKNDIPFVGFSHDAFFGKTSVLGYINNYWIDIPNLTLSISRTYSHSLRFDPVTDELLLANAGCSKDIFVQKYIGTTAIAEKLNHENRIQVYPNPSEDLINIKLQNESNVKIYSIMGETVYDSESKNILHIVKGLSTGIYIVDVSGIRIKIIVQ